MTQKATALAFVMLASHGGALRSQTDIHLSTESSNNDLDTHMELDKFSDEYDGANKDVDMHMENASAPSATIDGKKAVSRLCQWFGKENPREFAIKENPEQKIEIKCSNGMLGMGLFGGATLTYAYKDGKGGKETDSLKLDPKTAKGYILSTEGTLSGFKITFPKGAELKAKLTFHRPSFFPGNLKFTTSSEPAPVLFLKCYDGGSVCVNPVPEDTWGEPLEA